MVGLRMPGISEMILSKEWLGAFKRTYLLLLPACTASILKSNFSTKLILCGGRVGLLIRTASELKILSTSVKPFINSVEPELTTSQIPSANTIIGAIITEQLITG